MFTAMKSFSSTWFRMFLCIACTGLCFPGVDQSCVAQEPEVPESATPVADDARTIIINPSRTKPLAFLYAASARSVVHVGTKEIVQSINLKIRILQGESNRGDAISLGLGGKGEVIGVEGDTIASWAVRTTGTSRFLDLQRAEDTQREKRCGHTDTR
jgi:hypothetical protein